jgi:hypothetical protein
MTKKLVSAFQLSPNYRKHKYKKLNSNILRL